MAKRTPAKKAVRPPARANYSRVLQEVAGLLESARHTSARAVNAVMTATYWEVGRRIVEFEQRGVARADYGEQLIDRLSQDLSHRLGRGFSPFNLRQMRRFYLLWPPGEICQTPSSESARAGGNTIRQTLSGESSEGRTHGPQAPAAQSPLVSLSSRFPLPWSHYVRLLSLTDPDARAFYEREGLRNGWSVRQLDRQISTLFYERTIMSRKKTAALRKGARPRPGESPTPEEAIKDPFILEFLNLKDEYSESDVEQSLIQSLEAFLMELGGDFAFVGRQRRLRIDDEWYRIDLLFFHRLLRCLIIIDLKLGRLTHADAGQMNMYLNYAGEHWTLPGENPPIGLILCASKGEAVAKYALGGLANKVLAAEYRTALPSERRLAQALTRAQRALARRRR